MEIIVTIFEIIGTIAFAMSGAWTAIEKKMDIFGVAIIGMTTAIGGGVVRDLILGNTPPVAFREYWYAAIALATSLVVFLPFIRKRMLDLNHPINVFVDALGLATFTVVGIQISMTSSDLKFLAVFVGVITGVGGGVLRDIFVGKQPKIFVKHFYACASLVGAMITVILWPLNNLISMIIGAIIIVVLRMLASIYKWSLPKP